MALQKTPDANFQRWFSNQIDLWSVRQRDWKEDGSDLMEEAELYYKEAKQTNRWGKKVTNVDAMYAFQAPTEDDEPEEDRKPKPRKGNYTELAALTAQLKQFNEHNSKWEKWEKDKSGIHGDPTYKWKL